MATFKIFDRADEFRIEIIGRFAGNGVEEVRQCWEEALRQTVPRRLSVDISRLSGYDLAGRKLLNEMYRHGTELAARTPSSLVFLNEISTLPRAAAPVITAPVGRTTPRNGRTPGAPVRALAAGQ